MDTNHRQNKYIFHFDELDKHCIALVGGKGANLGELVRAGFPVPKGFCVGVEGYKQVVSKLEAKLNQIVATVDWENPIDLEEKSLEIRTLIEGEGIPGGIQEEVIAAYYGLNDPMDPNGVLVAVRSSATSEDLPEASFAGQQETYLNVQGVDQLLDSVRKCWASLWTARAMAYRQKQGYDHKTVYLAVVIQRMVDSFAAGVAFSVNPLNNDSNEILITSSFGLGEVVVAGTVTPDVFVLDKRSGTIMSKELGAKEKQLKRQGKDNALLDVSAIQRAQFSLSDSQLKELGKMICRVENHYQGPQDIEWAFFDARLYLLQSRPITTLQQPGVSGHSLVTGKLNRLQKLMLDDILEHYPEAPSPLDHEVVTMSYQAVLDVTAELVKLPPAQDILRMDQEGRIVLQPPRIRPTWRILLLPFLPFQKKKYHAKGWHDEHREKVAPLVKGLMEKDFTTASIEELQGLLAEIYRWADHVCKVRFHFILWANVFPTTMLTIFLKVFSPRKGRPELIELTTAGLDYKTAIIDREISRLALLAGGQQEIYKAVLDPNNTDLDLLRSQIGHRPEGNDFLDQVRDFLLDYGYRTEKMYQPFSSKSWREEPSQFLVMLRAVLQDSNLSNRMEKERERKIHSEAWFEGFLQAVPKPFRKTFVQSYHAVRENHTIREDTLFALEQLFTGARKIVGEMGRRLVKEGRLGSPEDVIFLTREEIFLAAREDGDPCIYIERVNCRKAVFAMNKVVWTKALLSLSEVVERAGELKGKVGSPGVAEGPVRVIMGVDDFGKLKKGDVLVCPYTDPTWTPLFGLACAVVADTGGPLSHAAIVAREYGIPAILATKCGTKTFEDGEMVVVDGIEGKVYRSRVKENQ